MKEHWLVPGIICVVAGVYFLGQGEKLSTSGVDAAPVEPSDARPNSATKEDWTEVSQRVADDGPHSVNASAPAGAPVTDYRVVERTQFLDPDVKYSGITQTDVNRTVVNVGKHLDATDASPDLSGTGVSGSQQTPIDIGEYLDPDPMSRGLEAVSMSGASENNRSDIGPYLDPNAVTADASSVEPSGQRNVGSRLDVDH
jgi:hypothetical protein